MTQHTASLASLNKKAASFKSDETVTVKQRVNYQEYADVEVPIITAHVDPNVWEAAGRPNQITITLGGEA